MKAYAQPIGGGAHIEVDVALISIAHALARQLYTTADIEPVEGVPLKTEEVLVRIMFESILLVSSHLCLLLEEVIVAHCSCQRGEDAVRSSEAEHGRQVVSDLRSIVKLLHPRVVGLGLVLDADGGAELVASTDVQTFVVEVQTDDGSDPKASLLDFNALVTRLCG